jgi:nitrogen fixation protein FixH
VTDRAGHPVPDANVTLLLTRPHTEKEDQLFKNVPYKNGRYTVENLRLKNPGRYILRVRVQKGDAIGYRDTAGYFKPAPNR